ncbi:hypothetical protein E9232_001120 [Inquilinus ginsengisoli]|uniref:Uncharacterized protein n=1 Tax=Inquilinus ginsengisoli TaxID=363840 RepID=A0ABU1JJ35_9PROT|nr:hypothetical protein [Inquilinus ginsengisoli]MDR6288613.1 hypothetical protein [Inquilinus ginsengisoli]
MNQPNRNGEQRLLDRDRPNRRRPHPAIAARSIFAAVITRQDTSKSVPDAAFAEIAGIAKKIAEEVNESIAGSQANQAAAILSNADLEQALIDFSFDVDAAAGEDIVTGSATLNAARTEYLATWLEWAGRIDRRRMVA